MYIQVKYSRISTTGNPIHSSKGIVVTDRLQGEKYYQIKDFVPEEDNEAALYQKHQSLTIIGYTMMICLILLFGLCMYIAQRSPNLFY